MDLQSDHNCALLTVNVVSQIFRKDMITVLECTLEVIMNYAAQKRPALHTMMSARCYDMGTSTSSLWKSPLYTAMSCISW